MWIPTSAAEVEDAAARGALIESANFDAKADLPTAKKNNEIAKDVAAMATDGGVLLYGLGEDEHGQLTNATPISLDGVADRVDQVVSTSISEVPAIETIPLPSANDPTRGYLLVRVAQSERAPHMVIVNGENRFYGRSAAGNRILSEGEVARLYARRQAWEVDRTALLDQVIAAAPLPPRDGYGYLHLFARPVALDEHLLERAIDRDAKPMLSWVLDAANHSSVFRFAPKLSSATTFRRHGGDGWRFSTVEPSVLVAADRSIDEVDPERLVIADFDLDGSARLFCGRATYAVRNADVRALLDDMVAGNLEAFLGALAAVYARAGYHGVVDIGAAVTGIRGAYAAGNDRFFDGPPYAKDSYRRTRRVSTAELGDPPTVAYSLLRHFLEAVRGTGYNPWTVSA